MRKLWNNSRERLQKAWLTGAAFTANDLFMHAAAGAYSFFLSVLPIVLMVLLVLLRILNESPDTVRELIGLFPFFRNSFNLDVFVESVLSLKSVGLFEIIVGASIFWMARRFFASIQQSMSRIYKKRGKAKPVKENLVIIAGEVVLIVVVTVTVATVIAGKAFFAAGISRTLLEPVVCTIGINLFRFVPSAILFLFLILVYFVTPRTRPPLRLSLFTAAACTGVFAVVQFVFASFINMSRYNLVYGILSNVIVMLLEVYLFFVLMLFFAQYQYVCQFFDSFLLAELYLLPPKDDPNPVRKVERALFMDAPSLRRRYALRMDVGEVVFNKGEDSREIYYIVAGRVALYQKDRIVEIGDGSVFGEYSCVLNSARPFTAVCRTECELLKLPESIFRETIEVDGEFSRRTLRVIADYVRNRHEIPLFTDI